MRFEQVLFINVCMLWVIVLAVFFMLQAQQQSRTTRQVVRLSSVPVGMLLGRVEPYVRQGYHVVIADERGVGLKSALLYKDVPTADFARVAMR